MLGLALDPTTAAAFLSRLGEHIDYNINIMDREGVIIASRDVSRVGSYHDAARRLVETGAVIELVNPEQGLPSGVRPGVNLPIAFRGETIGVVGVTGDPSEVTALAYAVKTSVESMLELEAWKDKALRHQDRRNLLQNLLLYDDEASRSSLESLVRKLGFDPTVPRAPIIIAQPAGLEAPDAIAAIRRAGVGGLQDMAFPASDGTLIVFKSIRAEREGFLEAFESEIRDYVQSLGEVFGCRDSVPAWVGAFQTELGRYRAAYRQTAWLLDHVPEPEGGLAFLFDHILEYLSSMIPRSEFVTALDSTLALLSREMVRELGPSLKALVDSALNGKEAAARLVVHRNTFSARMDRLTSLLGRDPRSDPKALDLIRLVVRYAELHGQ